MNADEIVKELRDPDNCNVLDYIDDAADLIEALQAQLAKYDEVATEYGIDGKTMLTLAKSQIKTAQDNVELQERLATALEEAKKQHYLAFEIAGKADEYMRRAQDARNELCLKCGRYRESHNGACNGCRWKE